MSTQQCAAAGSLTTLQRCQPANSVECLQALVSASKVGTAKNSACKLHSRMATAWQCQPCTLRSTDNTAMSPWKGVCGVRTEMEKRLLAVTYLHVDREAPWTHWPVCAMDASGSGQSGGRTPRVARAQRRIYNLHKRFAAQQVKR